MGTQTIPTNPPKSFKKKKWIYFKTNSYWKNNGRNSVLYYLADHFYEEQTLEEKVIEKRHSCFDGESLPEWARTITTRAKE